MASKSAEEILGFEFDWLASDSAGHVALFSTAGGGFAPADFLRDSDAHDAAIDLILASPICTTSRFSPVLRPARTNTWQLVAERGLFAFDSDVQGGPYRLVASPQDPIRLDDLPERVAELARGSIFSNHRFSQLQEVPRELLHQRAHSTQHGVASHRIDSDVEMMSEEQLGTYARWLVYGPGRGSGINVDPRSYSGTLTDQLRALAASVEEARKQPTDEELAIGSRTMRSLESRSVVRALQQYVGERMAARRGVTEE